MVGENDSIPSHLLVELEKEKPSSDPKYWAKKGCKHCYGRGVIGRIESSFGNGNRTTGDCLCSCARKNWIRWRDEWLEKHKGNGEKSDEVKPAHSECALGAKSLPRVDRIDSQISDLKREIASFEKRVEDLPHHSQMRELEEKLKEIMGVIDIQLVKIKIAEDYERDLLLSVECLEKQILEKKNEVDRAAQEARRERQVVLKEIEDGREQVENELRGVQRDFHKASHRFKHQAAVAAKRVERLETRRRNIFREVGISPEIITDLGEMIPLFAE
jgi:hypothetical protein